MNSIYEVVVEIRSGSTITDAITDCLELATFSSFQVVLVFNGININVNRDSIISALENYYYRQVNR